MYYRKENVMQVMQPPKEIAVCIDFTSKPWKVKDDAPEDAKKKAKEWLDNLNKMSKELYGDK